MVFLALLNYSVAPKHGDQILGALHHEAVVHSNQRGEGQARFACNSRRRRLRLARSSLGLFPTIVEYSPDKPHPLKVLIHLFLKVRDALSNLWQPELISLGQDEHALGQ